MSGKQGLSIIAGLILLNIVTVLYFMYETDRTEQTSEIVATVGNAKISRENWMDKLETMHGKGILQTMINEEVILQLAEKQKLTVSDQELNIEPVIRQMLYGDDGNWSAYSSASAYRKDLEVMILLEKLLTKDAIITDREAEQYYKGNEDLQKSSDFYRYSHIVVEKKTEAEAINKELKAGAGFAEISSQSLVDKVENLGYVSLESEAIPNEYKEIITTLKPGEWSQPIKIKEGYAFLYINDFIGESELALKNIESTLKRKIAMEQINRPVSAEMLWENVGVDWIYGK